MEGLKSKLELLISKKERERGNYIDRFKSSKNKEKQEMELKHL